MLEELKREVYEANMELSKRNLVVYTWGNVSGFDSDAGLVAIKPSGISYDYLKAEDIVLVDFDCNVVEGELNPSSDTKTHIELYKAFNEVKGIVHTHSPWATSFAQAGIGIKPFGTTHADYFWGEIPCTRLMEENETYDYERSTGKLIVETFEGRGPLEIPAVLVNEHGPFTWGKTPAEAIYHAVVLEEVAKMAFRTQLLRRNQDTESMQQIILDKHFLRKHGKNAYYGQQKESNID